MSSNRLFLLFLLLVVIVPALLLWKVARRRATRPICPAPARVLDDWRARAPRPTQAPTASHRELPLTTMSEMPIPRRDENDRWRALLSESEAAIDQYLVPKINMDLASFIRCITFRVFAVVFLNVDSNRFVLPNLQLVTAALSDFYDDRRGKSTLPSAVQSILYEWLPREQFPASLGRILPAYEALWRIIAALVVTCEDDETKALRWVMLDFRDNPRDRQYRASFGSDGRSASAITDDVVSHTTLIVRPTHAATSTWPLSCIHYASASASSSTAEQRPTVQEALKFAALLASMVIGQIGVQYGISGGGSTGSQGSPWDQRRIFRVSRAPSYPASVESRPHASIQQM